MSAKEKAKMIATIAMWVMGIVIAVSAMSQDFLGTPIPEKNMVWLAIVPLAIAVLGTFMLWVIPELENPAESASKTVQPGVKAKRQQGDKLSLLLEMMDDDEREAFKQLLKQQVLEETGYIDGELPYGGDTLESLLNDDAGRRARR